MLCRTVNVSLNRYRDPSLRANRAWPLRFSSTGKGVVFSPNSSEIIAREWNLTSGSIWPSNTGNKVKKRANYHVELMMYWDHKRMPMTDHLNRFPSNQAASLSTSLSCHRPAKSNWYLNWKLEGPNTLIN